MVSQVRSVALVVILLCSASAVYAVDDLAYEAGLVSDYVFRGISQTDNGPAAQAGMEYRHSKGPYGGIWASNVDLPSGSDLETNLYFGVGNELAKNNIGWDLGYIIYRYNKSRDNFEEIYGSLSFDPATSVTVVTKLSNDSDNRTTTAEIMGVFKLEKGFKFKLRPGWVSASGSANDYRFIQLTFAKRLHLDSKTRLDVELSFTDTDIDSGDSRTDNIWSLSALARF